MWTVVKESNIPSDFLCHSFADVSKRVEKRVEPGSIPKIILCSPSSRNYQETVVQSTKEEPFSYSCRFDTYVQLTNISGAEIAIRLPGQTSAAKVVSRKRVWKQSFQNCTSGMPAEL